MWEFDVSGLKVVQSWLGYRLKKRKGRASSDLDRIIPEEWGSEFTTEFLDLVTLIANTLEAYPEQERLLDMVVEGPKLDANELSAVPEEWRKTPDPEVGQATIRH